MMVKKSHIIVEIIITKDHKGIFYAFPEDI